MTKEIKTGYKKTPIGWIPENWKVGRFAETAQIIMGQSPDGNSYNKKGTGVPLINGPTEFTNRYPLKKQWTTKPTKMSRPGDVLLCVRGSSTGRINIANDEYCIGRGIAAIRSNGNSDTRFLEYQLHSNVSRILRLTSGSTFPNIDSKSLSSILTPIPPLPEQRKIAQILSIWDKAVELTEKLIAAKERRKKGLMQQLLTGKRRLSGFYGRWRRVKLSEMCSHIIDGTHATPKYTKSGVPFYSVENVTNNDFENVKYISKEEHEKLKRRCNPEKGDILMTRIGSIGDCKLIDWDVNASIYVSLVLLKVNERHDSLYLSYALKSHQSKRELRKRTLTVAFPQKINQNEIGKVLMFIPTELEEQQAIAAVLSKCDNEIQLLKRRLTALRQQKKGLMQKLLTGKIRVKNDNKETVHEF